MKHLQSYQDYEQLNEGLVGEILKWILLPVTWPLSFSILQLMDVRLLEKVLYSQLLDVYYNLDVLVDTLKGFIFTENGRRNITDTELKTIKKAINFYNKILSKYPTLEDYKKRLCKISWVYHIKNNKYLQEKIMEYEPKRKNRSEIVEILKKIHKTIKNDDVVGVEAPINNWINDAENNYNQHLFNNPIRMD